MSETLSRPNPSRGRSVMPPVGARRAGRISVRRFFETAPTRARSRSRLGRTTAPGPAPSTVQGEAGCGPCTMGAHHRVPPAQRRQSLSATRAPPQGGRHCPRHRNSSLAQCSYILRVCPDSDPQTRADAKGFAASRGRESGAARHASGARETRGLCARKRGAREARASGRRANGAREGHAEGTRAATERAEPERRPPPHSLMTLSTARGKCAAMPCHGALRVLRPPAHTNKKVCPLSPSRKPRRHGPPGPPPRGHCRGGQPNARHSHPRRLTWPSCPCAKALPETHHHLALADAVRQRPATSIELVWLMARDTFQSTDICRHGSSIRCPLELEA